MHKCWNLMWWGKLNQWKILKTEPTENLHQPSHTLKCRKVITHKCPCINILSLGTSSYLECWNWTKVKVVWWWGNWTNGKFALRNRISASAIMKKSKNGHHFININHEYRKSSNYWPPPPQVWIYSFPSVNRNGISLLAIMEKSKNGCHFININHTEKCQITDPPQSLGLQFSKCQQRWNISVRYY